MSCDRDGLHGMGSLNTTRIALVLKFKFVITSAFPMETIQFFIDYSVTIFRLRLLTYIMVQNAVMCNLVVCGTGSVVNAILHYILVHLAGFGLRYATDAILFLRR